MRKFTVLLVTLSVLCAGCSTAPLNIDGNSYVGAYKSSAATSESVTQPASCRVNVGEFVDVRRNPNTLGFVAGRHIRPGDVASWVREGFESALQTIPAVQVVDSGSSPGEPDVYIDGEIVKAYVGSVGTSFATNLVIRVGISAGAAERREVVVRGQDTSVNWASGDKEIKRGMSLALENLVEEARPEMLLACDAESAKVHAETHSK